MMMTNNKKIELILSYLDEILPNVGCELNYSKDYELVVAVILSAQTTDAAVNRVTPLLWDKYDTLEKLANASINDVELIIKEIGLYKNKARSIISCAQALINDFNGVIPSDKNLLTTLPGVGNKTAGVVRCEIFKIADLPVDTHILRITKRLGLRNEKDGPDETEAKLKKLIPMDRWIKMHHQLIHFGRYICTAKNPHCENCKLAGFCKK